MSTMYRAHGVASHRNSARVMLSCLGHRAPLEGAVGWRQERSGGLVGRGGGEGDVELLGPPGAPGRSSGVEAGEEEEKRGWVGRGGEEVKWREHGAEVQPMLSVLPTPPPLCRAHPCSEPTCST
jgi:hypothetical protein